ncbi:mammaglobin-B-like [Callithrix jacchus]|uniref:mammaglobin-B-like n=1 Tax=Callithrix jacchus TaxID=9483 RepID=UPI0001CA57BF|nr:mammaglobin-B-like [Callithrix jacchus]
MKLLVVLMLAALPLCCYAGSGCQLLEEVVDKTHDPEVSVPEYKQYLQEFIHGDESAEAVGEFKQCFLKQSNETLQDFQVLMQKIYDSIYCALY